MTSVDSWETVSSEQIADCRVFQVRRDYCRRSGDGKSGDFFVIDSPNWVNVIATTTDGDVVMIEQFRQGTSEVSLELPGGIVDDGETSESAARRELLEETGYSSSNWSFIGSCRPNPAILTNTMHYFLASDCEKAADISLDPNESIVTKLIRHHDAEKLIAGGSITHSLAVAGWLYYRLHAGRLADSLAAGLE